MEKNRLLFFDYLFIVSFSILACMIFTPYLKTNLNNFLIGFVFLLSFVFSFFVKRKIEFGILEVFVALFLFIAVVYWLSGYSTCSIGKLFNHIITVLSLILFKNIKNSPKKIKTIFCMVLIFVLLFNILDNLRLNILYPNASESINYSWGQELRKMNVGGTIFTLLISLYSLVSFTNLLRRDKMPFIWFLSFLVSVIYVLMTSRAISIMTMIFGLFAIIVAYFAKKCKSSNRRIVVFSIALFALLMVFVFGPLLIDYIAPRINARLSERLLEIGNLLRFQLPSDSESAGGSRLALYIMSIRTFFSNPMIIFFGIGEHPSDLSYLNSIGIGGHSSIFDLFPQYGIIGSSLLLGSYFLVSKDYLHNNLFTNVFSSKGIILFFFILNSFLNNAVVLECLLLVYVFVPFDEECQYYSKRVFNGPCQVQRS